MLGKAREREREMHMWTVTAALEEQSAVSLYLNAANMAVSAAN